MLRLLVTACLLGVALTPNMASAQEAPPSLKHVEVGLWPEYDRPTMLVIYRVTLDAGTSLPATISLPVPTRAGEPTAVAQVDAAGGLVLADYELEAEDAEWSRLDIRAESTRLQVEYYDALTAEGDQRTYTLDWPAGWPVGELTFEVQQPSGAASMEIVPAPAEVRRGSDGLTYHLGSLGAQDGKTSASLLVRYVTSATGLTAGTETPATSAEKASPQVAPRLTWIPWAVAGLGAASLALGAVLYLHSRRAVSLSQRPRHPAARRRADDARADDAPVVFCHSCGAQAGRGDRFCRQCGTRLRV